MIDATIRMSVPVDKRGEVLQTIKALIGPIQNEPGCISCYYCVDAEEEHIIIFLQEGKTNEDLAILLGAMKPAARFTAKGQTAHNNRSKTERRPPCSRQIAL